MTTSQTVMSIRPLEMTKFVPLCNFVVFENQYTLPLSFVKVMLNTDQVFRQTCEGLTFPTPIRSCSATG